MQLKVALLIVVVHFSTMTSQRKDNAQYYYDKKKCSDESLAFRIKMLNFFVKINQFFGLYKPKKLKICETATTTAIPTTSTTVTTTTACTSTLPLVTLYRQYNPSSDDHFYTASRSEAEGAVSTYGYCNQKSPGMLATSANDCTCGASLKPVFRLYRTGDHFYTSSESEADDAVSMYGYMLEGIAFYCSDRMNYCGATLPLYRYQRNAEHFYTTDPTEAQGTYEGITCYIWPCTQCQDFSTNVCQ